MNKIIKMFNEALQGVETDPAMSKEEKRAFVEAVRVYKEYGEHIYRASDLMEVANKVQNLVNVAESVTLNETGDWFDSVTASRHMKHLKECSKTFMAEAKEIAVRQQRLESAYEDIGKILSTYYDI